MEYRPYRAASPESSAAAQGVRSLSGGGVERAFASTFNLNVTAGRRFESRLKLQPILSDEHVFAGWLSDAEAALLVEEARA